MVYAPTTTNAFWWMSLGAAAAVLAYAMRHRAASEMRETIHGGVEHPAYESVRLEVPLDEVAARWPSLPGSEAIHAQAVRFSSVRAGRTTQVAVPLNGHRRGSLREELRRVKQLLETGEIARATAEQV
jgi:hypothetical protein